MRRSISSPSQDTASKRILNGEIFATPWVNEANGQPFMRIMGWDRETKRLSQIDFKAIDGYGHFDSVYEIPMGVLATAFRGRFNNGGIYELKTSWEAPFVGCEIGAWVKREGN